MTKSGHCNGREDQTVEGRKTVPANFTNKSLTEPPHLELNEHQYLDMERSQQISQTKY